MKFQTSDDLLQCIADALNKERLHIGSGAAALDIELRLDTGAVAGFVEQFLQKHWLLVLAHAHASENEAEIAQRRQEMDDLIWSVTPKATAQQRKDVIAKLPQILRALNQALDHIQWHGHERETFFSKLAERQAALARTAVSPRRKIEYAVNAAQKASERLMAKQARRPRAPDEISRTVDAMRQGQWMDFQFTPYSAEPMLRYKLAWISPAQIMYIFVQQNGQDFFSISRDDLCKALREREACCVWLHDVAPPDDLDLTG